MKKYFVGTNFVEIFLRKYKAKKSSNKLSFITMLAWADPEEVTAKSTSRVIITFPYKVKHSLSFILLLCELCMTHVRK